MLCCTVVRWRKLIQAANLASLLHALKIAVSADHFGFCASAGIDTFEWGRSMLMTALRHPGMFCSLEGYRILFDMVRFKYTAVDVLVNKPDIYKSTVQEYLAREAFSTSFRDKYLVPLVSSLWGSNAGRILPQFPTEALYQLLYRHGLLSVSRSGPAWKRITAGANQFVQRMLRDAPAAKVHLKTRVLEAKPSPKGQTTLLTSDGRTWHFDHVIFAVDAQEAISILGSAIEPKELSILQHLRVSKHIAVLHSDPLVSTCPRLTYHLHGVLIILPSSYHEAPSGSRSTTSYPPATIMTLRPPRNPASRIPPPPTRLSPSL